MFYKFIKYILQYRKTLTDNPGQVLRIGDAGIY